jgi:AraC-like DNA-binding protein
MENRIKIDALLELLGGTVEIVSSPPDFVAFPLLGIAWEVLSCSSGRLSRQCEELLGGHLQLIEAEIHTAVTLPYTVSASSCFLYTQLRASTGFYDRQAGLPNRRNPTYLSLCYYPPGEPAIQLEPGLHSFCVLSFGEEWCFNFGSSYPAFSKLIAAWISGAEHPYHLPAMPLSKAITGLLENIQFTPIHLRQHSLITVQLVGKIVAAHHEQLAVYYSRRSAVQLHGQLDSYLEQHYMNKQMCDLPRIKKELGLSRILLEKLSKESLGCTLRRYIVEFRINKACILLLETNEKIREIAYRTGFPDLAHFTNSFKAVIGIHPSAYRKRHS